jgi:hypothetical protein
VPAAPPAYYYPQVQVPAPVAPPPPAPPPGYQIVQVPPGYALVPLPPPTVLQDPSQRELLVGELTRVDTRLDELRRQRPHIGFPVTMMVLSYGTALISTIAAAANASNAQDIRRYGNSLDSYTYDVNNDGRVDRRDENSFRHSARCLGAVAAVSMTVGLLSTIALIRRNAVRRTQDAERRQLLAQRQSLRQRIDYGFGAAPQNFQLNVQGRF